MDAQDDPASLKWLDILLRPVIELSIFGGSITFSVAVGQYGNPHRFADQIQTFLALGWFFFVLALGVATSAQMALSFQRQVVKKAFETGYRDWSGSTPDATQNQKLACYIFVVVGVSNVLLLLILLAFVFLSLCIVAYSLTVGWIAFTCIVLMMIGTIFVWIMQHFC